MNFAVFVSCRLVSHSPRQSQVLSVSVSWFIQSPLLPALVGRHHHPHSTAAPRQPHYPLTPSSPSRSLHQLITHIHKSPSLFFQRLVYSASSVLLVPRVHWQIFTPAAFPCGSTPLNTTLVRRSVVLSVLVWGTCPPLHACPSLIDLPFPFLLLLLLPSPLLLLSSSLLLLLFFLMSHRKKILLKVIILGDSKSAAHTATATLH